MALTLQYHSILYLTCPKAPKRLLIKRKTETLLKEKGKYAICYQSVLLLSKWKVMYKLNGSYIQSSDKREIYDCKTWKSNVGIGASGGLNSLVRWQVAL